MLQIAEAHYIQIATTVQFVLGAIMSVGSIGVFAVNWKKLTRLEKGMNAAVGVIGVLLAVLAPLQSAWQSRVEEERAHQNRLKGDRERATIERGLVQARTEAQRANQDATAARQSQAIVEQQLAQTKDQLAALRQKTQPRKVSLAQRRRLESSSSGVRGVQLFVACRLMDGESCDYANEIANVFRGAGIAVTISTTSLNDLPGRLAVFSTDPQKASDVLKLRQALARADFAVGNDRINENSIGNVVPTGVYIVVGRKAP